MNNKPLVSVVIPVYNGANFLAEAIDSALAQTYSNIEVIVVNDGSNDGEQTRNIALSYGQSINYFEKKNGGVSSALNYAIDKMNGQFFSWLSHDDKYYHWKTEKQVEFYNSLDDKNSIIFSNQDIINTQGTIIEKGKKYVYDSSKFVFLLLFKPLISGCTLLVPREAFKITGYFNENYRMVQDYDMWFRMINKGYNFVYLPIASGMTRVHEKQDTKAKRNLLIEENYLLFTSVQDWLKKELWFDMWDNKALLYFYLAFQYKRRNLRKLYEHNFSLGCGEIKNLTFIDKLKGYIYGTYVFTYVKYLSPRAYFYKLKLMYLIFIALLKKKS